MNIIKRFANKISRLAGIKRQNFFSEPRQLRPVSSSFGYDRGQPIRRYYIEKFLKKYADDVHGSVLEIGDSTYTQKFGGQRVTNSHILHATPENALADIVGDLSTGRGLKPESFDCMILTQTLSCIYDVKNAIVNSHLALKSSGTLLVTVPGISQISRYDMDRWGEYWRFTDASIKKLFGDVFGSQNLTIETFGNVLTAVASLHGMATHELSMGELDNCDPDYQVMIAVRAVKNGNV